MFMFVFSNFSLAAFVLINIFNLSSPLSVCIIINQYIFYDVIYVYLCLFFADVPVAMQKIMFKGDDVFSVPFNS